MFANLMCCGIHKTVLVNKMNVVFAFTAIVCYRSAKNYCAIYRSAPVKRLRTTDLKYTKLGLSLPKRLNTKSFQMNK